jgi:predicted dehydrogenase
LLPGDHSKTTRVIMKNDYLGVAVVGAGRIGTLRAKLAAKHPAVRYVAVSDADPARAKALAEQSGANFHSGSNEDIIANPEVNAVIVSTPEGEHAAPVCKALELGKPVLVEKPIALSLKDADAIIATLKKTGGTCASATAAATRNASCAPRSR